MKEGGQRTGILAFLQRREVRAVRRRLREAMAWTFVFALLSGCAAGRPADRDPGIPSAGRPARPTPLTRESVSRLLLEQFSEWKGTPYREGGLSRGGVDCSGFVYLTFREKLGVDLPRSVKQQLRAGSGIGRKKLASGDLLFFRTGFLKGHVGIYTGSGEFIHASASRGVMKSQLGDAYWARAFRTARRVLPY